MTIRPVRGAVGVGLLPEATGLDREIDGEGGATGAGGDQENREWGREEVLELRHVAVPPGPEQNVRGRVEGPESEGPVDEADEEDRDGRATETPKEEERGGRNRSSRRPQKQQPREAGRRIDPRLAEVGVIAELVREVLGEGPGEKPDGEQVQADPLEDHRSVLHPAERGEPVELALLHGRLSGSPRASAVSPADVQIGLAIPRTADRRTGPKNRLSQEFGRRE